MSLKTLIDLAVNVHDFAERTLTAIAMLAQHDATSLPKGDNSLSKRKPRNEKKKTRSKQRGKKL